MRFSELSSNQLVVKLRHMDVALLCEAQSIQEVIFGLSGKNIPFRQSNLNKEPDISIMDSYGNFTKYVLLNYNDFYTLVLQRLGRHDNRLVIPEVGSDALAEDALKSFISQGLLKGTVADMKSLCKKVRETIRFKELPNNLGISINKESVELPATVSGIKVLKFAGTKRVDLYFVYYITSETMVDLINGDILYFSPMRPEHYMGDGSIEAYIGKRKGKPDAPMYRNLMQVLPLIYTSGWQEFRAVLQSWFNGNPVTTG